MATEIYKNSGVDYSNVIISKDHSTGAAGILVNEGTGANAINVFPGAAGGGSLLAPQSGSVSDYGSLSASLACVAASLDASQRKL